MSSSRLHPVDKIASLRKNVDNLQKQVMKLEQEKQTLLATIEQQDSALLQALTLIKELNDAIATLKILLAEAEEKKNTKRPTTKKHEESDGPDTQ